MSEHEILIQGSTGIGVAVLAMWVKSLLKQIDAMQKKIDKLTTHIMGDDAVQ